MRKNTLHIALTCVGLVLAGCNATRWVPPGRRLLVHNVMTVDAGTLDPDQLQNIVKQKPNKRVFGRPLYLDIYNLRDPDKVVRNRAMKDSLCVIRNEQRKLEGKKLKACDRSTRGRNGEPPVILDSSLTQRSVQQLGLYAVKEGYFAAKVSDTTHYTRRRIWPFSGWGTHPFSKPKASVEYIVEAGRPWMICQVERHVDDPRMAGYVTEEWEKSLLKPGDRFDSDVIDAERTRIADQLKAEGYLFFTRDMVILDADTSAGDHQVDLLVRLERPLAMTQRGLTGTPEGTVYYLNDVIIDATRRTKANVTVPPDTVHYDGSTFLYLGKRPEFKPKALLGAVFLKPGERFNQRDADRSFRRLTNLRVFDRVDITYDTTGIGQRGYANCRIGLLPAKRQGIAVEGFGTNRGGFLGTSVNFNYRHKNLFRSMASLQTSLTVGLEAQQSLSNGSNPSEDASTAIGKDALFNTVELGPEASISFPRPFGGLFSKSSGSRLVVSTLYNYQRRPDYTRTLAKANIGVEFNPTPPWTAGIYPLEVNVIHIPRRSDAFAAFLDSADNAILADSYTDHMIVGERFFLALNTQKFPKQRNVHFLRITLEHAGHVFIAVPVSWFAMDHTDPLTGEQFKTIGDVRYAQFFKVDVDYRYYRTIHDRSSMAFRVTAGAGKPYGNLGVLPFETAFFSGGANGMRAWRSRTLGPGSYRSTTNHFDRIGEARFEANVEYRFKVFGYLEGALFSDVGNIWTLQPDPAKPGGEFKTDRFLGQIAVGTGLGARLNFDFFIVRFDLGLQTKDPGLPEGQRWIFQKKDPELVTAFGQKLNFNLGIGYPF